MARHRTLDATVKWSYQLLSESERLLFSRLSVFPAPGRSRRPSTCVVATGSIPRICSIFCRGLSANRWSLSGAMATSARRYRFLETVRQYAHARLTEAGAVSDLRDRHFAFFHREFRDALHTFSGPNQAACLRRLQIEQENVRAALEWGLSSPALGEKAVELAGALFWFWTKRGLFAEGRQWLERAAAVPAPRVLRARVALGLGHMDYFQGRDATGTERRGPGVGSRGRRYLARVSTHFSAMGSPSSNAARSRRLRRLPWRHERPPVTKSSAPRCSSSATSRSSMVTTIEHWRSSKKPSRDFDASAKSGASASCFRSPLACASSAKSSTKARAYASEALSIYRELEDPRGIAWSLDVFAGLIATEGHAAEAARLWGASDGLLATVGGTLVPTIGWIRDRYFEPARAALGERAFEAARAEGRAMAPERAIALASRRFDLVVGNRTSASVGAAMKRRGSAALVYFLTAGATRFQRSSKVVPPISPTLRHTSASMLHVNDTLIPRS